MPKLSYSIGDKFSRLKIIEPMTTKLRSGRLVSSVICLCDCGGKTTTTITRLRSGHTKSCGCMFTEKITKHKKTGTTTYRSYYHAKNRCDNKNDKRYYDYGGRGIKFLWKSFKDFYEDMGDCPSGSSLDRTDNNGNYCKENCKWSTPIEQQNNTRDNIILELYEKKDTLANWARKLNIDYSTLLVRIRRGWTHERALTTPTKWRRK